MISLIIYCYGNRWSLPVQALMAQHQLVASAFNDDSPMVEKLNEEQKDKMRKWLLVQPLAMFIIDKSSSWGQPVSAAFVQLLDGAIRLGEYHGSKLAVTNLRQEMAGFLRSEDLTWGPPPLVARAKGRT